jgi:hypothetical protein
LVDLAPRRPRMPCRCDPYDGPATDECGATMNDLGEMLCYVLSNIEPAGEVARLLLLNPKLANWWSKHQKLDEARLAQEARTERARQARAAGLGKLTPEERAALGLNR